MTKLEMLEEIGLLDYYGNKQEEANKRMLKHSKDTIVLSLQTWKKCSDTPNKREFTREFIGRVLTGIFKRY